MALTKILKGRSISKGCAEGEALVCHQPIGFNFGFNVAEGTVIEHGHELENKSVKGKVLIFPHGKGSTGGSYVIYQLAKAGTGPVAMINVATETIIAVGAIMSRIPVVDSLDQNPLETIRTGDFIRVDADKGIVEVQSK
jgi:predicted aconitase with swiveling domain